MTVIKKWALTLLPMATKGSVVGVSDVFG